MSTLFSDQTSIKASLSRRLICAILANLMVLNFCIVPVYAQDSTQMESKSDNNSPDIDSGEANGLKKKSTDSLSKKVELEDNEKESVHKSSQESNKTVDNTSNNLNQKSKNRKSQDDDINHSGSSSNDTEAVDRSIDRESDSNHSKLDSLLKGANVDSKANLGTSTQGKNSKSLIDDLSNKNTDTYGSKGGLKELDSVRIARPDYFTKQTNERNNYSRATDQTGGNDSSSNSTSQPIKVAPNIVRNSNPKLAPSRRPNLGIGQASNESDTRIKRPNALARPNLPDGQFGQDTLLKPKEDNISAVTNVTSESKKAKVQNSTIGNPIEPKASSNLIPGLKPQTPVLAAPSKTKDNPTDSSIAGTGNSSSSTDSSDTAGGSGLVDITKVVEKYPTVGRLETLTFGTSNPEFEVGKRLDKLENSIFARAFGEDSLFDRTERLKRTLLGVQTYDNAMAGNLNPTPVESLSPPLTGTSASERDFYYLDDMARMPENLKTESPSMLNSFAEELINFERKKRTLAPLEHDELVQKMADRHMESMIELKHLSHSDYDSQNPDRRYTKLGGVDAVTEGLVATSTADLHSSKLSKAAVCVLLKKMFLRQDDREALLAPEATHIATSFGRVFNGTKIYGCTEVLTRRAEIDLIGIESLPGEKVQISGSVTKPYKFDRITIAWEEVFDSPIEENPDSDEALPYFPPLDYIAYSKKSEKDFSKAIIALKALGVVAAIAGGVFVPPVALAAPLIVMAGPGGGELKPQSDIPVKGGVKLHGSSFKAQIPLDNESQEGLYYITVWASLGDGSRSFPVSRRVILVTSDKDDKKDSSQENSSPIEYTNESVKQNDSDIDAVGDKDKDSQAPDNDKEESNDDTQGI